MDKFRDSYVTLFRSVTKSIENLEKLTRKENLSIKSYILIKNEIYRLKQAQIMAEEKFISHSE